MNKGDKFVRIAWISSIFLCLIVILLLVIDYKVRWEDFNDINMIEKNK